MVEVDTTSYLTITVNFLCSRCDERIRKDISKLQRQKKIEKQVEYDNYLNKVKITGFNPERLMEKLQRKACKICMHVRKITMVPHQETQEEEEVINGAPPSPAAAVEQQQQKGAPAAAAAEQEEKEEVPPNQEAEEQQEKEEAAEGQQQQQQQQQGEEDEEEEEEGGGGGAVLDNELEDHPSKWAYDSVPHFPQCDEKDYCRNNIFCEDDATAPCTIL